MLKFFLRRRFCLKRSETLTEPSADRFEPSKSFEVHMVFKVKNFFSRKAKKFIQNSGNVRAKYKVRNFFQEKYVQLIHTPLKGNGCYFLRLSSCSFPFLHLSNPHHSSVLMAHISLLLHHSSCIPPLLHHSSRSLLSFMIP